MSIGASKLPLELRIARMRAGVSVDEISTALKVTRMTVYNWENGRSFPRRRKVKSYLRLIKMDPGTYYNFIAESHKS